MVIEEPEPPPAGVYKTSTVISSVEATEKSVSGKSKLDGGVKVSRRVD